MKKSNSSDRLQELMSVLGINQTDLASRTGLNRSVINMYVHGNREPRQDKVSQIADAYGIDPAWLMGYDVPMHRKVSIEEKYSTKTAEIIIKFQSNNELLQFLCDFDSLDDIQKKSVMALVASMRKK